MSAPNAGDFSCSDLLNIQVEAESVFANDVRKVDYEAQVNAALAVIENQTATFDMLTSMEKDRTVTAMWISDCDETVENCGDDCVIGGATAGSQCKDYQITQCISIGFTVPEKRFRTNNFNKEQVIAKMLLKKMKALDEYIAQFMVGKLNAFAGENLNTDGEYTVTGVDTEIPAYAWNEDLFGYLAETSIVNKLSLPILLSGRNLSRQAWKVQMETTDPTGKSAMKKMFEGTRPYFDLFNVDSTLGEKVTFLINPNSIGFVSKNYYPETPIEYNGRNIGQKRSSMPSMNLPGVRYDYYYDITCVNSEIYHNFSLFAYFDMFLNPLGCDDERTGVLRFKCAA